MCMYLTFPTCNSLKDVPLCCGFLSCRLGYVPVSYSKYTDMVMCLQVRKSQCSGMAHAALHMHVHHWHATGILWPQLSVAPVHCSVHPEWVKQIHKLSSSRNWMQYVWHFGFLALWQEKLQESIISPLPPMGITVCDVNRGAIAVLWGGSGREYRVIIGLEAFWSQCT